MIKENSILRITIGSAVTAICNTEDEYEECSLKAQAITQVLSN
jgi:anthranilate/para-aminobenzoate synthase component I